MKSLVRQLDHVVYFCANPKEFSVFSIDLRFNIINDIISLTVTKIKKPVNWTSTCIFTSSVNAPDERLKNLFWFCKLYSNRKV